MAKITTFFLLFLSLSLLSHCGGGIPPMGFDVEITPKTIAQTPAPLDLPEAIEGGPLYVFDVDTPDPTLRAYRRLKLARVNEMLEMMDEEREQLDEVVKELPAYRGEVITFLNQLAEILNQADAEQATLRALALDTIQRQTVSMIRTTDTYARLEGLSQTIDEAKKGEKSKLANAATLPMFQYTRWLILAKLTDAISDEFSLSQARAGNVIAIIRGNEGKFGKKAQKLAKKFEKRIGKRVEEVDESFREALVTHMGLMACFESLKAADYAFTMAMLEFMEKLFPGIAQKADGIKANEIVTAEDKAFAAANARFLTAFADGIRAGMKNAEPPPLFRVLGEQKTSGLIPPLMGVAHAGVMEMLDQAAGALTSGAREMGNGLYGMGKAAASAPFDVARKVQQGVGSTIAFVDTGVGTAMDKAMNRYYGNSRQDEMDQIAATRAKAQLAAIEGRQGADTMRTARDYLDHVEKGVGKAVEETVGGAFNLGGTVADNLTGGKIQNIWGRDTVSWGAGKIAEMTTGMATGFGKGVLNLTNPGASNEELLEGTIDTTFSFIGGSKAVVKGSQVVAGAKEAAKEAAEKLTSAATRLELKLESSALKGTSDDLIKAAQSRIMSGGEIAILCDNTRRIMENEMKEKVLKDAEKSIGKILGDLAGNAKSAITGNLEDAGKGAKDFVTQNLDSGLDAAKATFGATKTDFADNLAGGQTDNLIKAGLKSLLLPDQSAADLKAVMTQQMKLANLDPNDPKNKEAIEKIQAVLEEKQKALAEVKEKAQQAAVEKTEGVIKEQLLKEMEKEADTVLSTPVTATGSFSGQYKGGVTMTLTPGGGPVSGTVSTGFGSASINGSVGKDGSLNAGVSGTMSYDWYEDGVHATKKTCSLSGSVSGTVGNRRVSGTYSTTCGGAESASGSWVASW